MTISEPDLTLPAGDALEAASLAPSAIAAWRATMQSATADYAGDCRRYSAFWTRSSDLLAKLPPKPKRNAAEAAAATAIFAAAREHRERFLGTHAEAVYNRLTRNRTQFVRIEDLVIEAAAAVPGLTPAPERVADEGDRLQRDKDGVEIDQGIFLAHVLACERAGRHLCHAMLLPRPEAAGLLAKLGTDDVLDLGAAVLERRGKAIVLTAKNPRYLNAEDETTLDVMEIAADLAILDSQSEIAVLRGGRIDHPKYGGRRVFGAGINLTRLYHGRIPFVWFMVRDLGFVHKLLRGVARPDTVPDDVHGHGVEKPWIAAVEQFAIGGACQILLAVDYVLAEADSFMSLPARKEGIIPGFANLRMPRFTGDRIARQAIQYERKLMCDSPEGRLVCDEVASRDGMEAALDRLIDALTNAGAVSAVGNRRALRIGEEPFDLFRRYASAYARDQAYCCFSPALIANLERNWNAHNRKL
ncbi:MAG TPA: enoyl-CoA hydratase/isomerase family protein [Xanthobacteraceae bacterium]|jgi:thioesterase DpgC